MSVSVRSLREGLRENLNVIGGLNVLPYFKSNAVLPVIQLLPPSVEYHGTFHSGLTTYTFRVIASASLTTDYGPQMFLDELLDETGDRSVCAAVEADQTLGGVAQYVHCTAAETVLQDFADNVQALTSEWTVTVGVNGSA